MGVTDIKKSVSISHFKFELTKKSFFAVAAAAAANDVSCSVLWRMFNGIIRRVVDQLLLQRNARPYVTNNH